VSERPATVFVVDDDMSVRRGLERLLRAVGYHAETFASASEFLERAEVQEFDCLVLDVRMPGLNGFGLHEALVAAGHDVPIIFITGHGDIPMAVRAMKAGATDFLAKPFDEQALLDAVQHALSSSATRRIDQRPGPGRPRSSGASAGG
jgi:FixJ family two-component response regulator